MDIFNIDAKRQKILDASGNLLILGGPGSGKTTIALLKAKNAVEKQLLKLEQKVLFLSFARATITRVEEQAGDLLSKDIKKNIEINTYHGFAWSLLKNHGYLLNGKVNKIISPHEAAARLAELNSEERNEKLMEMFKDDGLIHFDLFAQLCTELLGESTALRRIISDKYPIIIMDEFQDTNINEWAFIRILGEGSKLIALADPDQRIYEFRGSDPKRINEYIKTFEPECYDFSNENNRSSGRDINKYGNDILTGENKGCDYNDVQVKLYSHFKKHYELKIEVIKAAKRLIKSGKKDWSLAVLVPTNALMISVSEYLEDRQPISLDKKLPKIKHEVAVSMEGPALVAELIATLLEWGSQKLCDEKIIVRCLINYILGRGGEKKISQQNMQLVNALEAYLKSEKIVGKNRVALIDSCKLLSRKINESVFSGNVMDDWIVVRNLTKQLKFKDITVLERDAKFIRLLRKGSQLNMALSELWKMQDNYAGASKAVSNALTQEHFSLAANSWEGINVMTIHKAKGKEFDEVIIYEGKYHDRILSKPERESQAKLNLRVAVTRARDRTLIVTPEDKPCELL